MNLVRLPAATAALLLSTTVAMAQESPSTQNFFLDVDGTPVRVTAALAQEACGLDEIGVQEAAASMMDTSGIDAATADALYASTDIETYGEAGAATDMAAADATADMEGVLEGAETTAADTAAATETTMTPDEQMLALSVCQIDATRAAELGISGVGDGMSTN